MSAQITLEPLNLIDEKTTKEWIERFEALCLLSKVAEASKVNALIAYIGANAYRVLSENLAPKLVSDAQFADLKQVLLSFKATEALISVARYKFAKIEQNEDESVQSLYNKLNAASMDCKFDTYKEKRLRDQIVVSLRNKDLIQVILQIKNEEYLKLTAKDLVQKIQAVEIIQSGMSQMTNAMTGIHRNEIEINFNKKGFIQNCYRCGKSHKIRQCPAYGKTCSFCDIKGHFKHMCKKKKNYFEQPAKQKQTETISKKREEYRAHTNLA